MNGSPMDALQDAIEKTRRGLFPFRFSHWLPFAFVAFLDQCGRKSGGGFNVPNIPTPPDRHDSPDNLFRSADPSFDEALDQFETRWRHGGSAVIRGLIDADAIELLGGPLAHPFQPLLDPRLRAFSLSEGLYDAQARWQHTPRGIWGPECAFTPGMETGFVRRERA